MEPVNLREVSAFVNENISMFHENWIVETITIKIYKKTHDKLKAAHVENIGREKKVMSFVQFCDDVISTGLKHGSAAFPKKTKKIWFFSQDFYPRLFLAQKRIWINIFGNVRATPFLAYKRCFTSAKHFRARK